MKHVFYPLLAGTLLCCLSANAQQQDSTGKDMYELSLSELVNISVTTASKKEEKLTDAPATMQVISSEQIKKRGYVYLKDVLTDPMLTPRLLFWICRAWKR